MQNPYIQQLGLQPMEQQAKPLEGILNPRTLTTFGASLLAGGEGKSGLSTIGNAILNTQNYVDQYNQRINEGAMKNASFNLQLANSASDYDIKQQQLGLEGARVGLGQQELGLKQQAFNLEQQKAEQEQNLINSILNGGAPASVASNNPDGFNAMQGFDASGNMTPQGEAQFSAPVQNPVLGQSAPQAVDSILPMANKYMQIGTITGNAGLMKYGKELIDQSQTKNSEYLQAKDLYEKAGGMGAKINEAKKLVDSGLFSSGFGSGLASSIGGTTATDLKGVIDSIKSDEAIGTLMKLKSESKTGASGFGVLSDKELNVIQSAVASLDQSQSDAQLKKSLDLIASKYDKIKSTIGAQYGLQPSQPASTTVNWSDL